jgi:uncharacterized protein YciI
MKNFIAIVLIASTVISCTVKKTANEQAAKPLKTTNTLLARQLCADQYGMKQYIVALLRRGPNRSHDSIQAAELQRAHLDNIKRLANEGKLIISGPFLDDGEIRGIYIFNVATIEEAQQLTNTDPAIKAGRLAMELHPWYGSAALMKVNEIHKRISKTEI